MTTAVDGEDALAKVAAEQPPLIVLDIIMPKMNGYQVLRHLKGAPETRDIKVILVSSKNQESDRFWGLKQGADDYIAKPYPEEALLAAVSEALLMEREADWARRRRSSTRSTRPTRSSTGPAARASAPAAEPAAPRRARRTVRAALDRRDATMPCRRPS